MCLENLTPSEQKCILKHWIVSYDSSLSQNIYNISPFFATDFLPQTSVIKVGRITET